MLASLASVDTAVAVISVATPCNRGAVHQIYTWQLPSTRFYPVNRRGVARTTWKSLRVHDSIGGQSWPGRGIDYDMVQVEYAQGPSYGATCTAVTGVVSGKKRGDDLNGSSGRIPVVRCCCYTPLTNILRLVDIHTPFFASRRDAIAAPCIAYTWILY